MHLNKISLGNSSVLQSLEDESSKLKKLLKIKNTELASAEVIRKTIMEETDKYPSNINTIDNLKNRLAWLEKLKIVEDKKLEILEEAKKIEVKLLTVVEKIEAAKKSIT